MLFYERAYAEKEKLMKENTRIRKKLEETMDGTLQCRKCGNI